MDEERARLTLGLPLQLPASALGLHQLLVSLGSSCSGVATAGEFMSRSDALSFCSLQPSSVSLEEARSSIARALFLGTDSIAYSSSASHGVLLVLNTISDEPVGDSVSPRQAAFMHAFRCFCSTVIDTARALRLTIYFPDFTGSDDDQTLFGEFLSSLTPFPAMEPEGGQYLF